MGLTVIVLLFLNIFNYILTLLNLGNFEEANPQITVIFETQSTKYMLNIVVDDYTYSTLTSATTTIPTISTSITTDATSDTKTASPKAVKDYVDSAILGLLGGES